MSGYVHRDYGNEVSVCLRVCECVRIMHPCMHVSRCVCVCVCVVGWWWGGVCGVRVLCVMMSVCVDVSVCVCLWVCVCNLLCVWGREEGGVCVCVCVSVCVCA